jgi:hypothetical protein
MAEPSGPNLILEHPTRHGLRAAFPLIRLVEPEVDLRSWLRFAEPLVRSRGRRRGVVTVRYDGQAHPSGLFCFRLDRDLRHGEVLTAEHLVVLDLLDPAPLLSALLGELEVLAERLGCGAVRVAWLPNAEPLRPAWPAAGRVILLQRPLRGRGDRAC